MNIRLVLPVQSLRESFLCGLREFQQEGLPWWVGGDLEIAERDFGAFVEKKLGDAVQHPRVKRTRRSETIVPKTHLWAVFEERFVGRITIHHELNDALRIEGGHIGYDTVPSMRGRGVAKEMLRQALPAARALGLPEVLLTCDETNMASIRVIEHNGGTLCDVRVLFGGRGMKRYYRITL
jgi:predicted acetyltransferase